MYTPNPIIPEKNNRPARPEVYKEVHKWIQTNIPGENFSEKLLTLTNFYKKHYGKPPIITISEEIIEEIQKKINDINKNG